MRCTRAYLCSVMSNSDIICTLREVALSYKKRHFLRQKPSTVLSNLNLEIRSGETLGVIGRNGAGKSTLLKIIAGVIKPNAGQLEMQEGVTSALLTYQLGFNDALTGKENAIYSSLLLNRSRVQAEASIEEIFEFAGLESYIDTPLSQYSSGMRARLGFSVALFADPDMILIDEALGVGDHQFREKSTEAIKDWILTDKTVVFVSHDESSIRALCDRVIWLEHGNLIYSGDTNEVLDLYLSFDHFVKSLSKNNPQWSEESIRSHPLARAVAYVRGMAAAAVPGLFSCGHFPRQDHRRSTRLGPALGSRLDRILHFSEPTKLKKGYSPGYVPWKELLYGASVLLL